MSEPEEVLAEVDATIRQLERGDADGPALVALIDMSCGLFPPGLYRDTTTSRTVQELHGMLFKRFTRAEALALLRGHRDTLAGLVALIASGLRS